MPDNDTDDTQSDEVGQPSYQELVQKLAAAEGKVTEHWDRILRMQAEHDNVSRRVERDIANAHKFALEKFVLELLPIVDSLELCLTSAPKHLDKIAKAILDGVELTLKMFYNALEKFGVKQVNPIEETFDPEYQQAISMQYDPDVAQNTVLSVLQKGYTLNDRLLRPALVVVSKSEA